MAALGIARAAAGVSGDEIKPLTSEECGAFLEASRGERLEALYVLAVHCGLREGELLALRWEGVDLEAALSPPCKCGAPSPVERTDVDTSWARAPSPARDGERGSPGERLQP